MLPFGFQKGSQKNIHNPQNTKSKIKVSLIQKKAQENLQIDIDSIRAGFLKLTENLRNARSLSKGGEKVTMQSE